MHTMLKKAVLTTLYAAMFITTSSHAITIFLRVRYIMSTHIPVNPTSYERYHVMFASGSPFCTVCAYCHANTIDCVHGSIQMASHSGQGM